jgi:hypothetical protein
MAVCISGNYEPFLSNKYKEHLSAMLLHFKEEVTDAGGVFDVFVHVDKPATHTVQVSFASSSSSSCSSY